MTLFKYILQDHYLYIKRNFSPFQVESWILKAPISVLVTFSSISKSNPHMGITIKTE